MDIRYLSTFTVILLLFIGLCNAATVEITATADSNVKNWDKDASFPAEDLSPYKSGDFGLVGDIAKSYIQFTLPDDIVRASDVKFKITQTELVGVIYYYVIGINDDVLQLSPDNYTWNNAPANTPDYNFIVDRNQNMYDTAKVTYLGYLGTSRLDPIGTEYELDTDALVDIVNDDNDSIITIMMVRRQSLESEKRLASIENAEWPGPKLEITYTPAKVLVTQSDNLTQVTEGGASDSFDVVLSQQPVSNVQVDLVYDPNFITLNKESLTFESGNYSSSQTVTVIAVDDSIGEADITTLIDLSVTSTDAAFDEALVRDVLVHVFDNDTLITTLTASSDSSVKRTDPGSAFPTGDLSPKKVDSTPDDIVACYVQFELPADFEYAISAQLMLTQSSGFDPCDFNDPNIQIDPVYTLCNIIGVKDDISQPDADTYTWLNAPGNDTRVLPIDGLNGYLEDEARFLSSIPVSDAGPKGTTYHSGVLEKDEIASWLSEDDDGIVTFILLKNEEGETEDAFASIENPIYDPPKLVLTYADTPYCGQPGQEYNPYDINNDCIIDETDLSFVAESWLESTDPVDQE